LDGPAEVVQVIDEKIRANARRRHDPIENWVRFLMVAVPRGLESLNESSQP